jgi:gas vesicle protein
MNEEEMMMMHEEQEESNSDVIKWLSTGFGIGLLIGGIVGLLLAPKSGKETRAQIRSFSGELSDKTKRLTKDLGDKLGTTKDAVVESYKAGKAKYEEVKKND